MPILLAAVFAFWSSISRAAELPARRWHEAQATRFSIKSQPRRLEGGGSNRECYRKFKCQSPMNEIIFQGRRLGDNKLESELAADGPYCWHLRARGKNMDANAPPLVPLGRSITELRPRNEIRLWIFERQLQLASDDGKSSLPQEWKPRIRFFCSTSPG